MSTIRKIIIWIVKGSIGTIRISYALLAIGIILAAAYIFGGHSFLTGGAWGTDVKSALSMAAWVDKYFPHVPFWYPLAGGGVSITHSYPTFSFYLAALIKRLTDLDLIQSFRILGFSSVPLMALGIYAFVSLRFKNQTAALIASIFYLISPIAWVWLFDWGFYAEAVSHMFVMPTIIFWDLFFTSFIKRTGGFWPKVYLGFTVIFLSLAALTHFATGLGLLGFFAFYILGYTLKERGRRKKVFVRGILALFLVGFLFSAVTAFSTLPLYRYNKIAAYAGLGGRQSYEQIKLGAIPPSHLLGFRIPTQDEKIFAKRHISFPVTASVFAILGVLLSLQSARSLSLTIFAIYTVTLAFNAGFVFLVLGYLPWPLPTILVKRATLIPLRFIWPTLAALGAIWIFKAPFFWIRGKITGFIKGALASLVGLVLVSFTLLWQFGVLPSPITFPSDFNYGRPIDLQNIWQRPKSYCLRDSLGRKQCFAFAANNCSLWEKKTCLEKEECLAWFEESGKKEWCDSPLRSYFLPLGVNDWCWRAERLGLTLPKLCYPSKLTEDEARSFWQRCYENENLSSLCGLRFNSLEEQLLPIGWPEFEIAGFLPKTLLPAYDYVERISSKISIENPLARMDFSPFDAAYGMAAPYLNLDRELSQIYLYTVSSSSLIKRFRGQHRGAFYLPDPHYGDDPNQINDLARWWGINYVSLDLSSNIQLFREAGWELWDGSWKAGILKFPEENTLVDLSDRPTVLVIGQKKGGAYDQVFHLASYGVFPYEDAFLVWGGGSLDSYKPEEISQFDALLLHGYTYKSKQRADKLLADYVRGGGSLFIDTGWQYHTPDWETGTKSEALEVIPFNKLYWKDLGKAEDFVLEEAGAVGEVDVSQFFPLIYQGQSWQVSTGERVDLKDWANVILSVEDYPLVVAGEIGAGRVVWSGMNLFPHAKQGENFYYEEIKLLANLFVWLTEGAPKESFSVVYEREHPDKMKFIVGEDVPNGGSLLWKEAYHPDFHAQLVTSSQSPVTSLKTYRAGPSFTLIKVPELEMGDEIVYEYKVPLSERIATVVSFLTLLFLPAVVVEEAVLRQRSLLTRLIQAMERKLNYLFFGLWRKPTEWWGEKDEDA